MDECYLKFPTMEDKEKWLEYILEYRQDNPNARPLSCDENLNYEEWLMRIIKERDGVNLEKGRVPSTVYFLMYQDRIVGNLSLRHNINTSFLSNYGGHIGYGIRPSERRKGYATIMLHLALIKCRELGLTDVMITCKEENIGSSKTIENNYGIQKDSIYIPEENATFRRYMINVEKSLEKYQEGKIR